MRGREFIFELVQLMYWKFHKVNVRRGGSYIDSPEWIRTKKTTKNRPKISRTDDWKTFEKNNPTIALNIMYIRKKGTCPAYISKINSHC